MLSSSRKAMNSNYI